MNIDFLNNEVKKKLSQLDRIQDRQLADIESDLIRNYKRSLEGIKQKVARLYERLGSDPKNYYSDAYSFNRLKTLEGQIGEETAQLLLKDSSLISNSIKNFYSKSYADTSQILEMAFGKFTINSATFATLPKTSIYAIVNNPLDKIGWANRSREDIMQLTTGIRDELIQGLLDGKAYGQTAAAITDKMNVGVNKAFKIVSTETGRAQSIARVESFDQSEIAAKEIGLETQREWQHSDGVKDPRARHIELDGKHADSEGYFHLSNGKKAKAPKMFGDPAEDAFCHCTLIIQFVSL